MLLTLMLLGLAASPAAAGGKGRPPNCQCRVQKEKCNRPAPTDCKGGVIDDGCGCCKVCAKVEGEKCGGKVWSHGECDKPTELYCESLQKPQTPVDNDNDETGVCNPKPQACFDAQSFCKETWMKDQYCEMEKWRQICSKLCTDCGKNGQQGQQNTKTKGSVSGGASLIQHSLLNLKIFPKVAALLVASWAWRVAAAA